jgi:hypothetical protein
LIVNTAPVPPLPNHQPVFSPHLTTTTPPPPPKKVSSEVLAAIDELEPAREALFDAQTAAGMMRWNESLLIDLRFAGEGPDALLTAGLL